MRQLHRGRLERNAARRSQQRRTLLNHMLADSPPRAPVEMRRRGLARILVTGKLVAHAQIAQSPPTASCLAYPRQRRTARSRNSLRSFATDRSVFHENGAALHIFVSAR